jgi:DNA-binding NarL/FixJ family response regulator
MRELTDGLPWRAAIIDMGLPDAPGLRVAAEVKRTHPGTPTVIITGNLDLRPANASYLLGVTYLEKPLDPACLERFMRSSLSFEVKVARQCRLWKDCYHLTDAQEDILRRAWSGQSRDGIATVRDASPLTVKRQIADMLQKTLDKSLHSGVERLIREAAE